MSSVTDRNRFVMRYITIQEQIDIYGNRDRVGEYKERQGR